MALLSSLNLEGVLFFAWLWISETTKKKHTYYTFRIQIPKFPIMDIKKVLKISNKMSLEMKYFVKEALFCKIFGLRNKTIPLYLPQLTGARSKK